MTKTENVIIMGAAGRDFHDFVTYFRDNESYNVVAFTQAAGQNLAETDGERRTFPAELAGELYDEDIPILPAADLEDLIDRFDADKVVFSYSDTSHEFVMHTASRAISSGAGFMLLGGKTVMLESSKPVVAIDAVRTGSGKSQTTRKIATLLKEMGYDIVVVREPMPYGNLVEQEAMRFETIDDLKESKATIEEREEYEHHIEAGHIVYAGIDYQKILDQAEKEADIIVWDGGNNELPFFKPDLHFVLADPHRPGHELTYHPGEANLLLADYVIINKENTARQEDIDTVTANVENANPGAEIIHADSIVTIEEDVDLDGKRVLVIEDGPTVTHGGIPDGAGAIAARENGATMVDPRDKAVGSLKRTFEEYDHLGTILPAMGYGDKQLRELEETINSVDCDYVLLGTPADIRNVLDVDKPVLRVRYKLQEKNIQLQDVLEKEAREQGF